MEDEEGTVIFEIRESDLAGRSGRLAIGSRSVDTPALMPVVNPNLAIEGRSVLPSELKETFRFEALITNSYIIGKGDRIRKMAKDQGLHGMLGFDGLIMTDSGTFQSYTYGSGAGREVEVDPVEIVRFQNGIDSDIGTILDRFTAPGTSRVRTRFESQAIAGRVRRLSDILRLRPQMINPSLEPTRLALCAGSHREY